MNNHIRTMALSMLSLALVALGTGSINRVAAQDATATPAAGEMTIDGFDMSGLDLASILGGSGDLNLIALLAGFAGLDMGAMMGGFDIPDMASPTGDFAASTDPLTEFLGVPVESVLTEFFSGKSLAQIAEANGKTRDELKAFLSEQMTANLDGMIDAKMDDSMGHDDMGDMGDMDDMGNMGDMGLSMGSDALETFLGITADELHTAMSEGSSLAEIAEANGKTRDELKTFLTGEMGESLDFMIDLTLTELMNSMMSGTPIAQ
jgi:hypothetical protein